MGTFEFATDVQVRFRDIDAMGHVNNAVYATYLEHVRADYFEDVLGVGLETVNTAIATLELSYERPITLDQSVTATARVPELGTTSLPMEYEIVADGGIAAIAETVQVFVDEANEPEPIPEEFRERIEAFEGL